jgi:hypothetical protein
MNQITLKTFDNSIDAHILMARLESEDIECFLIGDTINSIYPSLDFTSNGVKLKIFERDYDKAIKVINDLDNSSID